MFQVKLEVNQEDIDCLEDVETYDELSKHYKQEFEDQSHFSEQQLNSPLYELLNQSTDGKNILLYWVKNKLLEKNLRNLLTRIIINKERDQIFEAIRVDGNLNNLSKFKIKTQKLIELSQLIEDFFPCESRFTYYTPFSMAGKTKINSSGTLYDYYNYLKAKLKKTGLLQRKQNHQPQNITSYKPNELENEKLNWLKNNLEPNETVISYWNETFEARSSILKNNVSVAEYYQNTPALGVTQGIQLLKADFSRLWPGKDDTFKQRWSIIRTHLVKKMSLFPSYKNKHDEELAILLPSLLDFNKDALIFYLLPHIIKSQKNLKRSKDSKVNVKDLTVPERRDSLLLHVEKPEELESALHQRQEELRVAGLTLQPIPFFVGPLSELTETGLIINGVIYKTQSAIDSIDSCFQSFQSLNCKYPERAHFIWLFIQICCYDIHLNDNVNRSLSGLIGEINHLFKNTT